MEDAGGSNHKGMKLARRIRTARVLGGWHALELSVNQWFALVGSILILFTMFLIVADIAARYVLSRPIPGTIEISEVALAMVIYGSVAYSQIVSGHVRMTLLYSRLPPRLQKWCDVLTQPIMVTVLIPWMWKSISFAFVAWQAREVTMGMVDIPVWIPKAFVAVGLLLLLLNCLARLFSDMAPVGKLVWMRLSRLVRIGTG